MLAAAQRLRRRGEFAAAIRRGRRAARGAVVVHLMIPIVDNQPVRTSSTDLGPSDQNLPIAGTTRSMGQPAERAAPVTTVPATEGARAGFVVPKAVGIAVVRNRVKRRLRHLVRDRLADLPPGADLVVRALPGAADRGYRQLGADLDAALAAARARKPARR
jgi:ribonuclease P protein component